VTPYASYYLAETGREKILAGLRAELLGLGLAGRRRRMNPRTTWRAVRCHEALDFIGSEDAHCKDSRGFFDRYIARSLPRLLPCNIGERKGQLYRHVAQFAEAFFAVETEALKVL